jgi:hypothetical protein
MLTRTMQEQQDDGCADLSDDPLVREVALLLAKKQRFAFASDFHALLEGIEARVLVSLWEGL